MRPVLSLVLVALLLPGLPALAADPARGEARAAACAACHGRDGIGVSDEFPNLAGQKAAYIARQLRAFRDGTRRNATMEPMAKTLSDADIEDLAAWFATLSPCPDKQASPSRPAGVDERMTTPKTAFTQPVFVSMKKDGTLWRFPDQARWQAGPTTLYDAVTPDGRIIATTIPSRHQVAILDAQTGKRLAVLDVGKDPKGVKMTPDGRFAWVSNQGSDNISVIDLEALKVVATIPTGKGPHNVRFTKDGGTAYVTLQGGEGLGVIDVAARRQVRVIPVPGITGPHNLDLSPDEGTAWVRDFVNNVAVVDLKQGRVRKVIEVGNGHGGIDVSPDGRRVATASIGSDFVTLIDPATFETREVRVGKGPHGIRFSVDGKWLYVTVTGENRVAVIDPERAAVAGRIPVDAFPFWIALSGNP